MKILFVCRGNIGRSQMAEAFFLKLSKKHVVTSAGTHVVYYGADNRKISDIVKLKENIQLVLKIIEEAGVIISDNIAKQLTKKMVDEADRIVVMVQRGDWPEYLSRSNKVTFWDIPDPKNLLPDAQRKIRDQIKKKVQEFVKEIG